MRLFGVSDAASLTLPWYLLMFGRRSRFYSFPGRNGNGNDPPPPSAHVLGDFNFRDSVWPDRLNKQGFSLSMSEGAKLVELISDHELEQVVHFPTRGQNTLDLIITSLPGQFVDIHSPDRLSDHDIVSGTLKIVIPPIKKPKRSERSL